MSTQEIRRPENGSKNGLLNTDLPKEVISKHKQVFAKIQSITKEGENCPDICLGVKLLSEQLERADKYFITGGVNENMTLDAKCISTNTAITVQLVKRLQTDSNLFDSSEFVEKLLTALNPFHRIDQTVDSIGVSTDDWIEFGRNHCRFHRVLPKMNFIHGSFDTSMDRTQTSGQTPKGYYWRTNRGHTN